MHNGENQNVRTLYRIDDAERKTAGQATTDIPFENGPR